MSDYNLTLFEACELLNRSKKSISRYIRRGLLHPQQIKSQQGTLEYRFSKADLEAFKLQETQDKTRMEENIKNWSEEFEKKFAKGNKWTIFLAWNDDDTPIVFGSHLKEIKSDIEQFISELLQRERESVKRDIMADIEKGFTAGYNYARKEMKQWAEENLRAGGEARDRKFHGLGANAINNLVLQELLEELK